MTRSRIPLTANARTAGFLARATLLGAMAAGFTACAQDVASPDQRDLERYETEVAATETAFAVTMARRDFDAFGEFIAEDAVFFSGPEPLRGKAAVTAYWQRFYTDAAAPFAWKPATVRVLASGTLAISTGPVTDPSGELASTYTSIWRREDGGRWRIVFDRGNDVCRCAPAPGAEAP